MHASSKSSNINVDLTAEQKKQVLGLSTASVDKKPVEKKESDCKCARYDIILGDKVDCAFRLKVVEICKILWGEGRKIEMANNLMVIMYFETAKTFSPSKQNSRGFTGLLQFGPDAASDLGTTTEKLKKMKAVDQLDYVKAYFEQPSFKLKINNLLDMYLAVNYPTMIKNDKTGRGNILYSAPTIQYHTNYSFMKEQGEYDSIIGVEIINGNKVEKRGYKIGSTFVWEVDEEMQNWFNKCKNSKWEGECENAAVDVKPVSGGCFKNIVKDGFLIDPKVEIVKNGKTPKITKKVEIIVLHRTHSPLKDNIKNLITSNKFPVHFWVNSDGKIYQQTSLENVSYHIGVAPNANTIAKKWGNSNSFSIEVSGEYRDKNGNRAPSQVVGGYWEPVTPEQAQSVACLVAFLLSEFTLSKGDIKYHEGLCAKTKGEGKTVYDAMLPLLK